MDNKDYFELLKTKPIEAKLRAFKFAISEHEYHARMYRKTGDNFYGSEAAAQHDRMEWIFNDIIEDYNKLSYNNTVTDIKEN